MPADQRKPDPGVIQRMLDQPATFGFFQTVRVWRRWLRLRGGAPERHLRFHNSISLSFPPSQVESLRCAAEKGVSITTDTQLEQAWARQALQGVHITPAFMGFLGQHGVLPSHYTDRIAAYERQHHDAGPRAWLDSLSDRALSLFHQAWARHRPECALDDGGTGGFLDMQLALAGAWPAARAADQADAIAHYAGLLRHRPVSAAVMRNVLADYFDIPIELTTFHGDWYPADPPALDDPRCVLGGGAMLGTCTRRCDFLIQLRLGPLTRARYEHFLPGRQGAEALKQWLALFSVPLVRYRIRLVLRAADARPAQMSACRLGVDAILPERGPDLRDRDDLHYEILFPGSVPPRRAS